MEVAFLALLLALAVSCCQARSLYTSKEGWTEADVIVIGAGMAGVTAARNLSDSGYKVIVLEATNRTAGRLKSTPIAQGGKVDLGAMWIHEGEPGNELYDLVTQALKLPISGRMNYNSLTQYTPSGDRTNRSGYLDVLAGWTTQVLLNITRLRSSGTSKDFPMAQIYSDWLGKNPNFTEHQHWQANTLMHSTWQALLSANFTKLSTLRYGDAKVLPAVDVMLGGGFDSVVKALQPGLVIHLNAVVSSIDFGNESVLVTTSNGSQYHGKLAILTPSLGVLKRSLGPAQDEGITFTPELPAAKQQAIKDMGFGLLDKTALVFDKPFWDLDSDFIFREAVDCSGRWVVFLNYWKLFKLPVLVAVHVAGTALAMEKQTDAEIVREAMQVLRTIYQKNGTTVPDPIQHNITRWAAEPHIWGSYSYFAVGNKKNITEALALPTEHLLWAGEHSSIHPASVWGAYLSGLREGQRAVTLLKEQGVSPSTPKPTTGRSQ